MEVLHYCWPPLECRSRFDLLASGHKLLENQSPTEDPSSLFGLRTLELEGIQAESAGISVLTDDSLSCFLVAPRMTNVVGSLPHLTSGRSDGPPSYRDNHSVALPNSVALSRVTFEIFHFYCESAQSGYSKSVLRLFPSSIALTNGPPLKCFASHDQIPRSRTLPAPSLSQTAHPFLAST